MDYNISTTKLIMTDTEVDPDGSDRGGFHQETHTVAVSGHKLKVELEVSDYYEERMGGLPETFADNKEQVVEQLEGLISESEQKLADLRALLENVRATTEFELTAPGSDDEEDDDAEDEDDEDDDE